jgi:hypothetical protein
VSRYEILLFFHVAFVILWLGSGFLSHVVFDMVVKRSVDDVDLLLMAPVLLAGAACFGWRARGIELPAPRAAEAA